MNVMQREKRRLEKENPVKKFSALGRF